jgi:hypothetical protein
MGGSKRGRLLAAVVVLGALAVGCSGGGGDDGDDVAAGATTTTAEDTTTSTTEPEETTTSTTEPPVAGDFIGEDIATALEAFSDAGVPVEQVETLDDTVPPGEVVDAAEQADGSVVLTVAARPVTRFLENVGTVDQSDTPSGPTFDISGTTYTHGVSMNTCSFHRSDFIEYDLGRDFRRLKATAGLRDDAASDARVRLEISVDGEIVSTQDVGLGDTAAIDLDVTGKLRVRFQLTPIAGDDDCTHFAFGDGQLIGVPSEVPPETGD